MTGSIASSFTERDKPLSFNWKAKDSKWLEPLGLPPAPSQRHEWGRSAILLDAVITHPLGGSPMPEIDSVCSGCVSYSRNNNWWAKTSRYFQYSLRVVIWAVEELALLGWLEHEVADANPSCGRQSRFRASPLLMEATRLPEISRSIRELIVLKDRDKRLTDYPDTIQTERWRKELKAQNEAIGSLTIDISHPEAVWDGNIIRIENHVLYPSMDCLYRVFNRNWKHGGRFYGGWWQNVKKPHRQFLMINGGVTAEEDYHQLHPSLLYRMVGKPLYGDAYTIDGWERKLRKKALNIIFNAITYHAALGAVTNAICVYEGPRNSCESAKELIALLKAKHAPISQYFHKGVGLELQALDAAMAENVMRRLRKQGIASLPIHDSFVVPANDQGVLLEAMDDAFETEIRAKIA